VGFKFTVNVVRFWFLFHFGSLGFGLLAMVCVMFALGLRLSSSDLSLLSRGEMVGLEAFVLAFALAHVAAFIGIVRRATWAWTFALVLVVVGLLLQSTSALVLKHMDQTELGYLGVLLSEIVVLLIPGIRTLFGPSARTL
jgi:hypothetical protein